MVDERNQRLEVDSKLKQEEADLLAAKEAEEAEEDKAAPEDAPGSKDAKVSSS